MKIECVTPNDPDLRSVRLLTAKEVAALCRVDRATVHRWTQRVSNPLLTLRFGARCTRFRLRDLEAFIESAGGRI